LDSKGKRKAVTEEETSDEGSKLLSSKGMPHIEPSERGSSPVASLQPVAPKPRGRPCKTELMSASVMPRANTF
jgi:hypothetical protein